MTFGERLTDLRISNGYTKRNEFADKIGIPSTTLRNYETGVREPGHTFLKQISEFFNVSVDYLLGLTDEKEVLNSFRLKSSEYDHIKKYRGLDAHGREHVNSVLDWESQRAKTLKVNAEQLAAQAARIAELEAAHKQTSIKQAAAIIDYERATSNLYLYSYMGKIACAGMGFYFDDIPIDTMEAPYMKDADFIIGVNGDSMEPDYHDGDKIYVKKTEELIPGDVGIFTVNDECFLKEFGNEGLISKNPKYNNIPGTEDVVLIGQVLGKVDEK